MCRQLRVQLQKANRLTLHVETGQKAQVQRTLSGSAWWSYLLLLSIMLGGVLIAAAIFGLMPPHDPPWVLRMMDGITEGEADLTQHMAVREHGD